MSLFVPEFQGVLTFTPLPEDFAARIVRRVETGLLEPGNRFRAKYRVRGWDRNGVEFGAEGLATAYAIGLNKVSVRRDGQDHLHYHVSYWTWTKAAVLHGLLIGGVAVLVYFFVPQIRRDVRAFAYGRTLFFALIGFFSLAWPWLLTALHKPRAERALLKVLRETLAARAPTSPHSTRAKSTPDA